MLPLLHAFLSRVDTVAARRAIPAAVDHRLADPNMSPQEQTRMRIGRTSAYRQVRLYFATNGAKGLRAERFGKQFRIPRYYIKEMLGGPITWPIVRDDTPVASPVTSITSAHTQKRAPRRATRTPEQDTLPFSA